MIRRVLRMLCVGLAVMAARPAEAQINQEPRQLQGVGIQEKLGGMVDTSLEFVDHDGRRVRLGDYLMDSERPVLLTLNYYRCKMLCSLQLNALTEGLKGLDWAPGKNFRAVTVSIDPRETPALARDKREAYLRALGRGEVDWSFLVGGEEAIAALADQVGFRYSYDEEQDQWAHVAAIFFLSPEGKVSRYLYGLEYPATSIKFALIEASEGRVGSPIEKIILSCFHYDETIGAYGPFAFGIMRIGAALSAGAIAVMLAVFWRRERARSRAKGAV